MREALCGLLCKKDIERGTEELHHHRKGAAGSGICFEQVPSLFGLVEHNHIHISLGFEVPAHQTECQGKTY